MRPKTCSYLTDDNDEIKNAKDTKNYVRKRNLKFEDYKNCLKVNQLGKEINYLQINKFAVDSLRKYHK